MDQVPNAAARRDRFRATPEPAPERYRLPAPLVARFGSSEVLVLQIGRDGAVIEHDSELPAFGPQTLAFLFLGVPLALDARVLAWKSRSFRNESGALIFRAEVEFLQRVGPSFQQLVQALDRYEQQIRDLQEANVQGIHIPTGIPTVSARGLVCVCFRYRDGRWESEYTSTRVQPDDGFTVSEHESEAQLRLLKSSYAAADEEGRDLIRRFAALSLLPPA